MDALDEELLISITGQIIDSVSGNGIPGVEGSLHMEDYQVQDGDSMFGDVFARLPLEENKNAFVGMLRSIRQEI